MNKIATLLFLLLTTMPIHAQVKVACVGNSVTYGSKIEKRELNSYPSQLQNLLGENYIVGNFGHPGATALRNGHKPYHLKPEYEKSRNFLPTIVIIHLGLNDQGNNNWPDHKEEFVGDYIQLIDSYLALDSKPRIIVCQITPSFSQHRWFEEGMRESYEEVQSKIREVSEKAKVELIDLKEPLYRFPELYADALHPSKEGAILIAKKLYQFITGDYGGLNLPILFGENMVLQRNEQISITGTANAKDLVKVVFNGKEQSTRTSKQGEWEVTFPPMKAGGPHKLSVSTIRSGAKTINKVYVGEVWLASGQSNMDFKVKSMIGAESIAKDSLSSNIFLFSMDRNVNPKGHVFSKEDLKNCNAERFFKSSGWSNQSGEILEEFSAIGYSFAYTLQKELKVPVGIICNAIGGSPIQSWISRESMETTHETIDLLNDIHLNPMVQSWIHKRRGENFKNHGSFGIRARHPFDPTFLYDSGILPLEKFNIKGVLWYLGESNAERVSFHSKLFKLLVKDWRIYWGKSDMPFNFVQLSSIKRPSWGHFRDSQRRLLSIPNTAMAVSSDVGHPTDVHPKEKWVVGKRLASAALAKNYRKDVPFSGPMLDYVNVNNGTLEIHFITGEGLHTSNNEPIKDVQIAGFNKVFKKANAKIIGNTLQVWSDEIKEPRYVRYGYTPYTEGNLVNKYGLPASTFSNLISNEYD